MKLNENEKQLLFMNMHVKNEKKDEKIKIWLVFIFYAFYLSHNV